MSRENLRIGFTFNESACVMTASLLHKPMSSDAKEKTLWLTLCNLIHTRVKHVVLGPKDAMLSDRTVQAHVAQIVTDTFVEVYGRAPSQQNLDEALDAAEQARRQVRLEQREQAKRTDIVSTLAEDTVICAVCLDTECSAFVQLRQGCQHVFHRDCLRNLVTMTPGTVRCPMCRATIVDRD